MQGEGGRRTPEDTSASERSMGSKGSASPSKSLSSSSSTSAENLAAAGEMEMKVGISKKSYFETLRYKTRLQHSVFSSQIINLV